MVRFRAKNPSISTIAILLVIFHNYYLITPLAVIIVVITTIITIKHLSSILFTCGLPFSIITKTNGHLMDKDKKLFPQRLWELVNDEKYNFCLRWSPDGQRIYLNRNEFENHYLRTPDNQFHTQKAISFVRQMNMYGFRKVDDCYYENDNFKKNCHHLLKYMIRRHSNRHNPSTLNEYSDHNTGRLEPYFPSVNQWNTTTHNDSGPGSTGIGGCSVSGSSGNDTLGVSGGGCRYEFADRQSVPHVVDSDNEGTMRISDTKNPDDNDSDDISGEIYVSGDTDELNTSQTYNEEQMASINSILQQFVRPNQPATRGSIDHRRLSEHIEPHHHHHLTLASQNRSCTASSMGNLNQSLVAGLNPSGISQSTLASTLLYEQLAELNFSSNRGDLFHEQSHQSQLSNDLQQPQPHQHQPPIHQWDKQQQPQQQYSQQTQTKRQRKARSDVTLDATNVTQNLDQSIDCSSSFQPNVSQSLLPQPQTGVPRNQSVPTSLNAQQSLAVQKAIFEQSLFRSLLQHQQSVSVSLHQNLLESLRQPGSVNSFNPLPAYSRNFITEESPAGSSTTTTTSSSTNALTNSTPMRPSELIVNSSGSSSENESFARRLSLESHLFSGRNQGYHSNTTLNSNMSGPSRLSSPRCKRGVEALDQDEECRNHDPLFYRTRAGSFKMSSSSASPSSGLTPQSRRLEDLQDDDLSEVILDLAKPKSPPSISKEYTTNDKKI